MAKATLEESEVKEPRGDVLLAFLHPNEGPFSFQKSLLDLIGFDLSGPRRLHSWAMIKCGPLSVPGGRNDACKRLLETDAQWMLMVDADMGFESDMLQKLLAYADPEARPIIGGLAFANREVAPDGMNGFRCFPQPTILDWIEHEDGIFRFTGRTHYPVNALIKAGATGGAILLIHRSVIERVAETYGPHWFDQSLDAPNGSLMGEDISFFARTQSLQIPLFINTGVRTSHFKSIWLAEEDFWLSFLPPPATEKIDVVVPVLHRPQNIRPFMESLIASTGLATAWFVCEEGDEDEITEVLRCGGQVLTNPQAHTFAEKVNVAYAETDAPWLLLVGDDVRFRAGWLDQALDVARRYGAKVIGTNDLANPRVVRGEHATHPVISRGYIDELGASWDGPGVVCHEGYSHWFVDDEIVTVAKQRGTFQAALASQVEHMHPIADKAEDDEVYRLGLLHAAEDGELFKKRYQQHAA